MMVRFTPTTVVWIVLLFVAAAVITAAFLLSLIMPGDREMTFYTVMIGCWVAEFVCFGYLLYVLLGRESTTAPVHAVRLRIMTMTILWTIAIIVSGALALAPSADPFYSDHLVLFQAVMTFVFLAGAYLFHRQGMIVAERGVAPHTERVRRQSYSAGIDPLLAAVRSVAIPPGWTGGVVEMDQLAKRLDTLKTQLLSAPPMAQRDAARLVQPVTVEEIERRLKELHETVAGLPLASPEELPRRVGAVRQAVDNAIASLHHREETLTL